MTNRHKKRCSTLLIIREMQVKTIIMYYFTLVRMASIKSLQIKNAGEGVEKREPSYTVGRNVNWYSLWYILCRTVWRLLKKLKIELPWVHAKSFQSCSMLCNPVDCSPSGSSIYGILQTRILEWVAMPSSRETSQPRDQTPHLLCLLHGSQVLYH